MDEVPPFLADYQIGVPHDPQMLRNRALGYVQLGSQGVNAQGSPLEELDDAHARSNGQNLEDSGQLGRIGLCARHFSIH